ncbi:rust resistance kinase Lr10 isoform X1 [Cinnamomum micranthum f. kanehirae]|uniref:Rust resistance kinase Lr10 isoform X1 n=1 Tax=Cinnamomum micranthum f. kanehirae TaxID=337451 RepID=A0A443NYU5_9MAGN|nr:rust resistance kinase Lr10 isoform X1 [Cinnamomum micranthum f. kanehirae]
MRKPLPLRRNSISRGFWPFLFFFLLSFSNSHALRKERKDCPSSSCGPVVKITHPFRLKQYPQDCGRPEPEFELTCENNNTQALIHLPPRRYYVQEISYKHNKIRLLDPALASSSSLPLYNSPPSLNYSFSRWHFWTQRLVFVNCSQPANDPSYVATAPCNHSSLGTPVYAMLGNSIFVSQLHTSCRVVMNLPIILDGIGNLTSCSGIHDVLMRGFYVHWNDAYHLTAFEMLLWAFENPYLYERLGALIGVFYLLPRTTIGILCFLVFLVYKFRRRHIWMDTTIEEFLAGYRFQTPGRYSYSNIKKMTKDFKEELGQGGYGTVFKGKLSTGGLVAIKILKNSKGNGQEFINEVATIGRIHHVNVVRLIGFCSEGSKRALIYEFMANGSLEKYVFMHEKINNLCWNKMYQIALGIARGIEYLHQGCDIRILHFDIKPHNILLDEKFTPKVSDFGLAKFYPTELSIVSVTAARGTMGYIAPELLYKTLGGVSHKSDVYSFGMLLLEMTGRRKNIDAFAEHSSQIYFPLWVYDQLHKGDELVMTDIADNDKETAKKMMIVALWCIQLIPTERPSMSKVIEMLEGSIEDLHMPPKPLLSSPQTLDGDHSHN